MKFLRKEAVSKGQPLFIKGMVFLLNHDLEFL